MGRGRERGGPWRKGRERLREHRRRRLAEAEAEVGIVPVDELDLPARAREDEVDVLAEVRGPRRLLAIYRQKRASWLGHLRSFIGVNAGLGVINLVTALTAGATHPWVLYVTASWGMGLVIHGLTYRGWLKDHEGDLRRARIEVEQLHGGDGEPASGGAALDEPDPAAPALPSSDDGWSRLVEECRGAVGAAEEALAAAEIDEAERTILRQTLDRGLETVDEIRRGALAVGAALSDVAPSGAGALLDELRALEAKIGATTDERLRGVYEVNRRLLEARRDKVQTLEAELERMEATVKGFLISAQNVRLDAARLGTGGVPDLLGSLRESLDRLDDEVEMARQVESELESL